MTHFILIIMLAGGGYSKERFATQADCMAVQRVTGGACVEQSLGLQPGAYKEPPLVPHKPLEQKNIGTFYEGSKL